MLPLIERLRRVTALFGALTMMPFVPVAMIEAQPLPPPPSMVTGLVIVTVP